jgi:hypothetical protein
MAVVVLRLVVVTEIVGREDGGDFDRASRARSEEREPTGDSETGPNHASNIAVRRRF